MAMSEDEFRLLAYLRGYVDRREQHLDPGWVQQQLEWSRARMRAASRALAERGLVEFFEFKPPYSLTRLHPEIGPAPVPCDICLTERGWGYLRRRDEEA
jgi:hypothetical protein